MKEIAIITMTRFGDLIQETPLLRTLRNAWPEARITLVLERRFAAILPLVHGYDRVITFAKDDIADRIVFATDPLDPYFFMEGFVRQLEDTRYDLVINLTFSHMSAYLVSLMNSERRVGLVAGRNGERVISSLWGTYLFAIQEGNNRLQNRINLVDLFTLLGGVKPDGGRVELSVTGKGEAFAESFLAQNGLAGERLIGLQMGASDAIRCWPAESFARLSDLLQKRLGVRTILFGSDGEAHLAARAEAAMEIPTVSAVGKTSIEELFSLLKRCSLLVTNDTGTMHFAAAGGVPSLMLCIGPAFFRGTGPYSAGNLALQADLPCAPCRYNFDCPSPVCREMLTEESVFNGCRAIMQKDDVCPPSAGVKVFRSFFDGDGYLDWHRCDGGKEEGDGLSLRYSRMWRSSLAEGALPRGGDVASMDCDGLVRLAGQGVDIAARTAAAAALSPLPLDELGILGNAEAELALRIKMQGTISPSLAPLVDFFSLMRDNSTTDDIATIAEETGNCYRWLTALASRL